MAQTIGDHGLYCPDPQDYGAYALYMQDLGNRIDEALSAQQDALNSFLAPPTIVLTNSAAVFMTDGSNTVFDTVVFNNSSFMTYDVATGILHIGSQLGANPVVPYRRGSYSAGMGARITAVAGVPTVGNEFLLQIAAVDNEQPSGLQIAAEATDVTQQVGTTGNWGVQANVDFLLPGASGAEIQHLVLTLLESANILAGSAFLWVTFNGATDIIEVA